MIQAAMADQLPTQAVVGLATCGLLKQNRHEAPYWFGDGRFGPLRIFDTQSFAASSVEACEDFQLAPAAAKTLSEASEVICSALMRKLAKAMMMELEDLDAGKPANSYGVDSLVAVGVRAWMFKEVKSDVSVFDILSNAPLTMLAAKIAAKSSLISAAIRGEADVLYRTRGSGARSARQAQGSTSFQRIEHFCVSFTVYIIILVQGIAHIQINSMPITFNPA